MNWRRAGLLILIAGSAIDGGAYGQGDKPPLEKEEEALVSKLAPNVTVVPKPPTPLFSPKQDVTGSSTQLVGYFVALAALVAGGFYLLKKGLPVRLGRSTENNLQLLETKMLGNRQFLIVVKYEDNKMLLGVGPGQIQYLCPLDSADADLENLMRKADPAAGTLPPEPL